MKPYALSVAFVAAFGAGGSLGWLASDDDMATMAKEVDAYRAAQATLLEEQGQYRDVVPTELSKALAAAVPDKRMLSGDAAKVVNGRVIVQLEDGNELQLPPSLTAKLTPEVDAIKAEWEAAVAAKAEALAAEEAAKPVVEAPIETPIEDLKVP